VKIIGKLGTGHAMPTCIYLRFISPFVTHGAETWLLTVADENALRSFERRMLRKMFVPVWNGGE
jgi:hypothetical protein